MLCYRLWNLLQYACLCRMHLKIGVKYHEYYFPWCILQAIWDGSSRFCNGYKTYNMGLHLSWLCSGDRMSTACFNCNTNNVCIWYYVYHHIIDYVTFYNIQRSRLSWCYKCTETMSVPSLTHVSYLDTQNSHNWLCCNNIWYHFFLKFKSSLTHYSPLAFTYRDL